MDISKISAMGGHARAKKLTAARRREIARLAGAANRGKLKGKRKKKNGRNKNGSR